ncbi:MAG: aspartyl/asparaginyl beta-hydroxylase domain-containing protein [Methylococcaceae bacterium]|nr:aspartyl/asparaginyl beta-hydroxylase domain-containing protein [Methylococcaceae bacterium]
MPSAASHADAIVETALRLPFQFDPARLEDDLARINTSDWQAHFNNSIYQGDWSGVALRAAPGGHMALYSDPTADTWADTALLEQCPAFKEVMESFACPLLSVRLLRLGPGAIIEAHRDPMLGLDYGEVRIHVVIATNPNVECRLQGRPYHWDAGECWYADFSCTHSFANRGDTERVHMVLDCKVNDWLRALLTQLGEASLPRMPSNRPPPLAIPKQIKTLDDWMMLKERVVLMRAEKCCLAHERVKLENGVPVRGTGTEANFRRIGFCGREIRDQQLGCAHTMVRYQLRDIIRALDNSGMMTAEDSKRLAQLLDSAGNEIQFMDHRKGTAEKHYAILRGQLNSPGTQPSEAALLAASEQIAAMEIRHEGYVKQIGSIRDRVLAYLEAGIARESAF